MTSETTIAGSARSTSEASSCSAATVDGIRDSSSKFKSGNDVSSSFDKSTVSRSPKSLSVSSIIKAVDSAISCSRAANSCFARERSQKLRTTSTARTGNEISNNRFNGVARISCHIPLSDSSCLVSVVASGCLSSGALADCSCWAFNCS